MLEKGVLTASSVHAVWISVAENSTGSAKIRADTEQRFFPTASHIQSISYRVRWEGDQRVMLRRHVLVGRETSESC